MRGTYRGCPRRPLRENDKPISNLKGNLIEEHGVRKEKILSAYILPYGKIVKSGRTKYPENLE